MVDWGLPLCGALIGLIVGLTGVGGGALMTPTLILFFDVPPSTAIATDLWFAAITKLIGGRVYHLSGIVDWEVARRLWLGSIPAAMFATTVVKFDLFGVTEHWVIIALASSLSIAVVGLLLSPWLSRIARASRISRPTDFKSAQRVLTPFCGFLLGICVSITSVGAGAIAAVVMLYLYPLRMKPRRLIATDIVHAIPLAVTAGFGYLLLGLVDLSLLLKLLIGSIPAVWLGSRLSGLIPARSLQILLCAVLSFVAFKLILQASSG